MPLIDWAARCPREVVLVLAPAEADDVPRHLARLVEQASPGRGDHITVDLGTATCVHLTGLHLLLSVLWRRVGPSGSVDLIGGSPSLRAQLASLCVMPQHVRRDVFGAAPAAPAQRQEPAAESVLIPQQRHGTSRPHHEAPART